ncbi:MAG: AAA family ATPase, partial [Trebonia sp.]
MTTGGAGQRLYGRERETRLLETTLDARAGGGTQPLFFEGAAGTGKSGLLAWARTEAHRRGWTVITGRASVLEAANDFGVLRQALATLPPLPDGRPAAALGPAPEDSSAFDVFDRVSAHLLAIASRDPVLITVDDLQWCDGASLRWLAYLANRIAGLPIAIVLAGSPGELSKHRFLVDELVAYCERQTLGRLTHMQVRQWVADLLGTSPDEAFVEGCLEATGGNEALLAELLPALAARRVPPAERSVPLLESVGIAPVSRRVMPWIQRGDPEALAVAQAVAVLGDDSYPVLVAQLAGLSMDGASRAIDQLIKLDILSDASPLRYIHSLTRAVVHTEMNAGLRTSLRLRASRVVHDRHAEPEQAAAHLMAVDMADDSYALNTLRAAAASALDNGRPDPALRYLRRALAEQMPDATRAELLAEIGAIETGLGVDSSGSTLRQALSLAAEPSLRVRVGVDLAYADAIAGSPLTAAMEIIDDARVHNPPAGLAAEAEFGLFLACVEADAGKFFLPRLPRLRELADGDPHLSALAGVVDAWSDLRQGRERALCVRRAVSALEAIDRQRAWELRLRWPAMNTLIEAEEYDLVESGGRFAHRQGSAGDIALSAHLRGRVAYGRGHLTEARAELRAALSNPSAAGTTGAMLLVLVLADLGELDAADRLISDDVRRGSADRTRAAAALTFATGSLCMARDQHREALRHFLEAGQVLT